MSLDAQRAAGLARTKLTGLVRGAFPDVTAQAESFNAGAGLAAGDRAFVYVTSGAASPLGAVLAWGGRQGAQELHVVVDQADPVLEVMAGGLDPRPRLWQAVGAELVAMASAPVVASGEPAHTALAAAPSLAEAGCEVVVEHGVVIGEVSGLEVARIVVEPDGNALVRVGVGLYDQEAHAMMHPDQSVGSRLGQVIAEVRTHRHSGAAPHPLNRAARERWLRSALVADPSLVGLDHLLDVEPLVPRGGIRESSPVAAVGTSGQEKVLVVCTSGIDLDLVPVAAGHASLEQPDRTILVLPERDHHPVLEQMATQLAVPATLTHVPAPWPS